MFVKIAYCAKLATIRATLIHCDCAYTYIVYMVIIDTGSRYNNTLREDYRVWLKSRVAKIIFSDYCFQPEDVFFFRCVKAVIVE